MKAIFLGTGTSQGVPVIGCNCEVCNSTDSRDKRLRTSFFIETPEHNLLIDAGPDFRQQILRENIQKLDAIFFTHEHKDHIGGLDDVRAFNYITKKPMEVYADANVSNALKNLYSYVFAEDKYPGVPRLNVNIISDKDFIINGIKITPVKVMHGNLPILGFRIGDLTYITDANYINPYEKEKIYGSQVLVINALRNKVHHSHYNLEQAMKIANEIGASKTYFTHISHYMGLHKNISAQLPDNMHLAHDGLKIVL